jgi:hypothetical protein
MIDARHTQGTGGSHADVRVHVRELQEKLYGDADHLGADERKGPMSELRKREGYPPADDVYREDLAEELKTNGVL